MIVNDWENRSDCKRLVEQGPVAEVRMHTVRDESGVLYEVLIAIDVADPANVQEHDAWREIWRRHVEWPPGRSPRRAFVYAARDQEEVAATVARWAGLSVVEIATIRNKAKP